MATELVSGQRSWSMSRDQDGHREYTIKHLVIGEYTDGPANALTTPGLPTVGSSWNFDDDVDQWAFCKLTAKVSIHQEREGDKNRFFIVEQIFSTKSDKQYCKDQQFDDPLLQPDKVSGSFNRFQEEKGFDRNGIPITNSAQEQFHGPQVEFDTSRPNVKIEQNVPDLELALCTSMVDKVNDSALWGLNPRRIKLSNFSWVANFYGLCFKYYTRTFDFDINFNTFDRELLDEGQKCLRGDWDRNTPSATFGQYVVANGVPTGEHSDYIRFKDWNGENTTCILNGAGVPISDGEDPGAIDVEYYSEANFLLLGIPISF